MLFSIDVESAVSFDEQIKTVIFCKVSSGELKEGDPLAPIKELAEHLDVNASTVSKAYRDLQVQGLVFARRGDGHYVAKDAQSICNRHLSERLVHRIHEIAQQAKDAGFSQGELVNLIKESLSLGSGLYQGAPESFFETANGD